ncbi:MAG: hypothetical protein QXU32_09155 [Nitrososphaerales archaeon]
MRFVLTEITNVLGLQGSINFLKSPVLLYGRNIAGKTNVVNLLRYCFVPSKSGKKYTEDKRLNKDELLLNASKDGMATFYFEHKTKLFKLEYQFKRSSKSVNQKIYLYEASGLPSFSENALDAFKNIKWNLLASNASQLKDTFNELNIYTDVIGILISPSNVRNFAEAINNELVTIPDIIAKQISGLHNSAEKLLGNLQKLQNVLGQEKETYQNRLNSFKDEFEKVSFKKPEEVTNIFMLGNIFTNLDEQLKSTDQELSKIPSVETQLELLKQKWATEFKDKLQKIGDAKAILQEEEQIVKQTDNLSTLAKYFETVKIWNTTFNSLPSKENIQALMDFKMPNEKEVDFSIFLNPQKIENLFGLLKNAKHDLEESAKIAEKYNVNLTLGEIRSQGSSYKKLEKAIKSPEDKPEGSEAIIRYSDEDKKSEVYIPLDVLLENPNYLRGIKETLSVFKSKKLGEKDLEKLAKTIKQKADDLEECGNKLRFSIENYVQTKQLVSSLTTEVQHLENKKKEIEINLNSRLSNWRTISKVLADTFHIEYSKSNLATTEGVRDFASWLRSTLKKIEVEFISGLKKALVSVGVDIQSELDIESISSIEDLLKKQSEELSQKRNQLKTIKEWISTNINEIREIEDQLLSISLTETAAVVLDIILQKLYGHTNLESMSEQIAESIEENVRKCVEMIMAEEMVIFRHIGKGNFLIETINGEAITHPAGSHKAVISLGIMLTLSQLFDLPIILDEATDRFDYHTLRNTFHFVNALCSNATNPQVCLVSYKTLNIEKNQDILDIIKNWSIYLVERKDKLRKEIIKLDDINQILA